MRYGAVIKSSAQNLSDLSVQPPHLGHEHIVVFLESSLFFIQAVISFCSKDSVHVFESFVYFLYFFRQDPSSHTSNLNFLQLKNLMRRRANLVQDFQSFQKHVISFKYQSVLNLLFLNCKSINPYSEYPGFLCFCFEIGRQGFFIFGKDEFELFQGAEAGCDLVKSLLRLNCKESGGVQILDCPLYDQVADLLKRRTWRI